MNAGTKAFFGEKLLKLDPNLVEHFLKFDTDNWKLWYKWPRAKELHEAKREMVKSL